VSSKRIERTFVVSNLLVLPFWLLMIVFPHWRWTRRIMQSLGPVVLSAGLYAGWGLTLLRPARGGDPAPDPRMLLTPHAAGIAAGLGQPAFATLAWAHLVAFDLFAGRWVYLDSRERQISAWLVAPALALTLLAGPAGFLLYLGIRALHRRSSPAAQAAALNEQ
jgi:hypothetical protein